MVKGDDPFHLGTSSLKLCLQKMLHFRIVNLSRFARGVRKRLFLFLGAIKKNMNKSKMLQQKKQLPSWPQELMILDEQLWRFRSWRLAHFIMSKVLNPWQWIDQRKTHCHSNSERFNLPALTDFKKTNTHTWLYVQMYKRNHVNGNHIRKRFLTRRALIHRFPFSNLKTLTGFSHFEGIPKPSQHLLYCKTRMLLGLLVGTCKSWNPAVFQDASVKRAFWISTSVVSQMSQRSSKVVDFGQMYRPTRFPGMIRWYSSFARIW